MNTLDAEYARTYPFLRDVEPGESPGDAAAELDDKLREHGAVLLRGCAPEVVQDLGVLCRAMGASPLSYADPATPRTEVGEQVYTSTDYPSSEVIELHHEGCYSESWPSYLYFGCVTPAKELGGTTIADSTRVLGELPDEVVERFRDVGVVYVRTFSPHLGISWERVFGTADRDEVESICAQRGTEVEWLDDRTLQTRRWTPALIRHPHTGRECWFNQVVAFHPAALPADVRAALYSAVGPSRIPKRVLFGDGTEIPDRIVDEIRNSYRPWTVPVRWTEGDVLVVDNIWMAHGREPFRGSRRVLVSMSHPRLWSEFAEAVRT